MMMSLCNYSDITVLLYVERKLNHFLSVLTVARHYHLLVHLLLPLLYDSEITGMSKDPAPREQD